jgi:hypothetical protein
MPQEAPVQGPHGTSEPSTKPPIRALRYRYTAGGCMDFDLHMFSEVGQPYQPAARAQVAEILAKNPGWEVQTVELDRKPWLVDALVKPFAPPDSFSEERAIQGDLAISRMKRSGELDRMNDHRALLDQIKHGDPQ